MIQIVPTHVLPPIERDLVVFYGSWCASCTCNIRHALSCNRVDVYEAVKKLSLVEREKDSRAILGMELARKKRMASKSHNATTVVEKRYLGKCS